MMLLVVCSRQVGECIYWSITLRRLFLQLLGRASDNRELFPISGLTGHSRITSLTKGAGARFLGCLAQIYPPIFCLFVAANVRARARPIIDGGR